MRIAIVEDETMMVEHVIPIIASMPSAPQLSEYASLRDFLGDAKAAPRFDLVLLDLGLPDSEGIDTLKRVREQLEDVPVVVFSGRVDRQTILAAIDAGAMGFVPKTGRSRTLRPALELVLAGGVYLPMEVVRESGGTNAVEDCRNDPTHGLPALTRRQRDVLRLLVKGLPNKLICRELNLSENTVKSHLDAIFRVLDVSNRTQAVLAAQRMDLRVDYQRPS